MTDAPTPLPGPSPDDPNERDYIVIDRDEEDSTRFVWRVYAGNHYLTHRSNGSYSRKADAIKAARREHPETEDLIDKTKRRYPIPR